MPLLEDKFRANLATRFPAQRSQQIMALCKDSAQLSATPVHNFMDRFVI